MGWVRIAKTSDIVDGGAVRVDLEKGPAALFKSGNNFYVISNTCPHKGGSLVEGFLENGSVTCPWHAWDFDVRTGACGTVPGVKVKTYTVRIKKGEIFVKI